MVVRDFHVREKTYSAGSVIARGYVDTGDHVFVDKISYNFRNPHRGDVFVFNTQNIATPGRRLELMGYWRNAIAHQDFVGNARHLSGRTEIAVADVRQFRSACGALASTIS